jgi:predicted nucleic acid-binding protein
MPDKTIIVNSGPLIALAGVNQLDILPQLYQHITVPLAVADEIRAGGPNQRHADLVDTHKWIHIADVTTPLPTALPFFLGKGETEVITLALADPTHLVLIDDYRARRTAEALHITATGTAGVLVRAKRERLITAVTPLIQQMRNNGYYISETILAEARRRAGE